MSTFYIHIKFVEIGTRVFILYVLLSNASKLDIHKQMAGPTKDYKISCTGGNGRKNIPPRQIILQIARDDQ
jgi:hypothetical protein